MAVAGAAERVREAVLAGVFAALVFAATLVSVEVPATQGYFNLGESMVYTAAILGGPWVGMVAGGVGSALADVYLGYSLYAPGTLVIKGVEGFLAGWLYRRLSRAFQSPHGRRLAVTLAIALGAGVAVAGATLYGALYGGPVTLTLWGKSVEVNIPLAAWIALGAAIAVVVAYAALRLGPDTGAAVLASLTAGTEMVAGYFIYEYTVVRLGITAAAEIPVNLGQMLIGAAAASFIVSTVKAAGWSAAQAEPRAPANP